MLKNCYFRLKISLLFLSLSFIFTSAYSATLEEVIVTAQKREQSIQDVGIAVTALNETRLLDAQVNTVQDLQYLAPGLTIGESFGFAQIMIRGVGTDNPFAGGDPSVAMHVDGVVIGQPSAQLGTLFDVQRIEVLRGPQGTLYGRNNTGGSLNVITHKPTEELSGYGRLTGGNDALIQFEGAVGGPITEQLQGRVAVKVEERDGYGMNLFNGNDIDDASRQSGRVQLQWLPADNLDILLAAQYHRENDTNYVPKFRDASFPDTMNPALMPQPVGVPRADNPRDIITDTPIQNQREQWSVTGTVNWELNDRFKMTSITNFQETSKEPQEDFDFTGEPRFSKAGLIDTSQFSQELQLHFQSGRLHGLLGLYYFNEEIESDNRLLSNAALVPGLNDAINIADESLSLQFRGTVNIEAAAVFASVNYDITDRITLEFGGRLSYENRKGFSDRIKTPSPFSPTTFAEEGSFNDFTPKAGIQWNATEDLMLYFSYTEGFKSGILIAGQSNPLLDPETVEAFEVGAKGTFLNNRLQLNAAGFIYDYTDLQVGRTLPAPGGFTTIFENAAEAEVTGAELEAEWLVTERFFLQGTVTYLDATFEDFLTRDPFELTRQFFGGPVAEPEQLAGKSLLQAPEWAWTLRGEYRFDIPPVMDTQWQGRLGLEVAFKDDVFFTPQNVEALGQSSTTVVNANLAFASSNEKWTLNLWGKNLTDKLIYTGSFVINTTRSNAGMLAPPRTFGATLGYNF